MKLSSNKPYLMRAIYEWLVDNEATPHIVILADLPEVNVPRQYVDEGKIVLNISPTAARDLLIDAEGVSFSARFAGKPFSIYAPIGAIVAIYASENGEGMLYEAEQPEDTPPDDTPTPPEGKKSKDGTGSAKKPADGDKKSKRPALKVVK